MTLQPALCLGGPWNNRVVPVDRPRLNVAEMDYEKTRTWMTDERDEPVPLTVWEYRLETFCLETGLRCTAYIRPQDKERIGPELAELMTPGPVEWAWKAAERYKERKGEPM